MTLEKWQVETLKNSDGWWQDKESNKKNYTKNSESITSYV